MTDAITACCGDVVPGIPGWPDWTARHAVDDEAFAAAHDAVGPRQRALIKQTLARMFAVHAPDGPVRRRRYAAYEPDVAAVDQAAPRRCALVAIGAGFASPARLLAACLPALRAGVGLAAVVRTGGGAWPEPLLAALELCGLETAFSFSARQAARFFTELAGLAPDMAVVDFTAVQCLPVSVRTLAAAPSGDIGVWRTSSRAFDLKALAEAQAGSRVTVWGKTGGLPPGMQAGEGDFAAFLAQGYEAVFVPGGKIDAALAAPGGPDLVLGPGMEWFWVCRGVSTAAFMRTKRAFLAHPQSPGRVG